MFLALCTQRVETRVPQHLWDEVLALLKYKLIIKIICIYGTWAWAKEGDSFTHCWRSKPRESFTHCWRSKSKDSFTLCWRSTPRESFTHCWRSKSKESFTHCWLSAPKDSFTHCWRSTPSQKAKFRWGHSDFISTGIAGYFHRGSRMGKNEVKWTEKVGLWQNMWH